MQSIDHVSSVMSKWGRATAKGDRKVLERFPGSKEVLDKVLSKVLDSSGYGSVLERFQRRYPKRHTFQHTSRAVWDVTWANLTKELSICYKFVHQLPILRPLTLRHCTWGSCLYSISPLYHSMLIIYMLSTNQDKFSFVCAHPSMKQLSLFLPLQPFPHWVHLLGTMTVAACGEPCRSIRLGGASPHFPKAVVWPLGIEAFRKLPWRLGAPFLLGDPRFRNKQVCRAY